MPVGICTRESTARDDARDDNSALKSADLTGDLGKRGHFSNDYALGKDDGGEGVRTHGLDRWENYNKEKVEA